MSPSHASPRTASSLRRTAMAVVGLLALVSGLLAFAPTASAAGGTFSVAVPANTKNEGNGGGITQFPYVVNYQGLGAGTTSVIVDVTLGPEAEEADFDLTGYPKTVPLASFVPSAGPCNPCTYSDSIPVVADNNPEGNETFSIIIRNPSAGDTIGTSSAGMTIADDDGALPVLRIGDASVTEGTSANPATRTRIDFAVTVSPPSTEEVRFTYTTEDGVGSAGAGAGSDYDAASQAVTIPAGQSATTISLDVIPDAVSESNETFRVRLSDLTTNVNPVRSVGTGTIVDDDGSAAVSVNDPTADEDTGSGTISADDNVITFDISIDRQIGRSVRVNYATSNGTATAGQDYAAQSGSVVFPAGSVAGAKIAVNIPLVDDNLSEADETIILTLSGVTNAVLGDATGTGTIIDDDVLQVGAESQTVTEGNGTANPAMSFSVTLNRPSSETFTVDFATVNGTAKAGADFTAVSKTVTFAPGEVAKNVDVTILSDDIDEDDENFTIALTNPTSGPVPTQAPVGTITDDDAAPAITIADTSVTEGNTGQTNMVFTITLSRPTEKPVSFEVDTALSTGTKAASAPSDFSLLQDIPVSFVPLDVSETISVPVQGDLIPEDDETFQAVVQTNTIDADGAPGSPNANGVTVADGTAIGTILDDEAKPAISIADAASGSEGNNPLASSVTMSFNVSLSTPSAAPVTVDYTIIEGDAVQGSGLDGGDFTKALTGSVEFGAGSTLESIDIPVVGDTVPENDETFSIVLSNPTGATINDGEATGTINDDDAGTVPTVAPRADVSVTEGTGGNIPVNLVFTIDASSAPQADIDIRYHTSDGSAVAPKDYASQTGVATITAGTTSTTITIPVVRDNIDENNETMTLTLDTAGNATITDNQAIGTILDDDDPPIISIGNVTVTEGNVGTVKATFTVSLNHPADRDISVDVDTSDVEALAGVDYSSRSTTVTVAAEASTTTFDVTVVGDVLDEPNESFKATLSDPSYGTLAATPVGIGNIADDDAPPTIVINDASTEEGDAPGPKLNFLVSLSGKSSFEIKVDYESADGPDPAAEAPGDYDAVAATLTIPPGDAIASIPVTINPDNVEEPDENMTMTLSSPQAASIADGSAIGTITDDDDVLVDLSIDDIAVIEGNSGTKNAVFTVTMESVSPDTVDVDFETRNGSAVSGSDYTRKTGRVRFSPGDTEKTISVAVKGDTKPEANETFSVVLSNAVNAEIVDGSGRAQISDDDSKGTFKAVTPARLIDTRKTAPPKPVGQGQTLVLDVAGQGGVPATGADSVVLNVTVVNGTAASYLSVTPDGSKTTSSLNFSAGQVVANHVTVPLDDDGRIKIYNRNGSVDVIVDVFGWYHDGTRSVPGSHYKPVSPTRLGDTRSGLGGRSNPLGSGQTMSLDVTTAPVPLANVAAVVLNVTVVNATQGSFVSVTPTGGRTTSSINFAAGDVRANLVTVPVGPDGKVRIYNQNGTVDVVVDVFGYYAAPSKATASTLQSQQPSRLVDTRNGTGGRNIRLGSNDTMIVQVAGVGGVPANATAVVLNATAVDGTAGSYLSLTPSGGKDTSNLNFIAGDIVPNQVIVPLDSRGRVRVYNRNGSVHVLLDVYGAFI